MLHLVSLSNGLLKNLLPKRIRTSNGEVSSITLKTYRVVEFMTKKKCKYWGIETSNDEISSNWSHKHDFPIEEIWGTCHTLARLIVPRLQAFKALDKHGYAPGFNNIQEWNKAIQKMIDAFELIKYPGTLSDREKKTVDEGFSLFYKYFFNLWD